MLEKLVLRNFQKHKKLTIEFSKDVTTLIAGSDFGKSSCLRAIRWTMTNKPNGTSFIHWGKTSCAVMLIVDGHRIVRKRGKENTYELDGKKYKSFGNEVPGEIAAIFNIDPDINISTQHQNPQWMMDSPAQVSKELNRIVNLEVIDTTLSNAANELRKAKSVVEVSESRLKQAKQKRDQLLWVKEFDQELVGLEKKASKISKLKSMSEELSKLLAEVEELEEEANRKIPDISCLEITVHAIKEMERGIFNLNSLLSQIDYQEKMIISAKQQKEEAETELKEKMKGICPLCGGEYDPS